MAKVTTVTGIIIDESQRYSLKEICQICGVHAEYVMEMVEYGILEPAGKQAPQWHFSLVQLERIKKALRLQQDLEINLSGIALALELLEEIESLHTKVNTLEQQLTIYSLK